MEQLLYRYKNQRPTVIFEWHDTETEAEGWVVINSLRGGAAGGGTRMRKGLNQQEVEALAKIMEIKFSISAPTLAGPNRASTLTLLTRAKSKCCAVGLLQSCPC